MVERVGKNQAARHEPGNGGDASLVRDITGRKNKSSLLSMQLRELVLDLHEGMARPRNVPGAARAGAHAGGGFNHGSNHLGVLPHPEIVVGAPDHDVAWPLRRMPTSVRKPPCYALEIGEHPISALGFERLNGAREI